jgi:methionine synthase II (cobalamin-independent)
MLETTVAGSLPKPSWLAEPEKLWPRWRLEGEELEQGKRDATLIWIKQQELAGIDIVSGGEQFRIHFVHGFLEHINGIDWQKKTKMGIRDNRYVVDVPTVTGAVSRKGAVHSDEVRYSRAQTTNKLKFTLPGPMTICDTIANAHYATRPDMAMAFAELLNQEAKELEALGADTIQFDEPAFNAFPRETVEWGVAALNEACAGLKCKKAVHICYGYGIKENIEWKKTLDFTRMCQFEGTDRPDRLAKGQGCSGRCNRCRERNRGDAGTSCLNDRSRVEISRSGTGLSLYQLRYGTVAALSRRGQAQGARRWCGHSAEKNSGLAHFASGPTRLAGPELERQRSARAGRNSRQAQLPNQQSPECR